MMRHALVRGGHDGTLRDGPYNGQIASKEDTMRSLNRLVQLTATVAFIAVAAAGTTKAATIHHAGDCGEYRYWHNAHCVDAREKPGKDWTASVY